MKKQYVLIISPALAKANNGNWQTARRWANFLSSGYRVSCKTDWSLTTGANAVSSETPDLLIALHARRSAPAITAFARQFPERPLVLILTGTDVYRDIHHDEDARRSLVLATRLVILQPDALNELGPALEAELATGLRSKTQTIFQSAPLLTPVERTTDRQDFDVVMIGHLRKEKRPDTFMQAACQIVSDNVRLVHIGGALELSLSAQASRTAATVKRYCWLGPLSHAQTRQRLQQCALMVICSEMEGGANVIIEAVTCGVPVLASNISGNRGMLGADYAGYFPLGDAVALANLIDRVATDTAFHALLQAQCAIRAKLFTPVREKAAVLKLVDNCLLSFSGASQTGRP